MGRDSSGVYTLPAGSSATDGLTAEASQHNLPLTDIAADMNVARPIVAGGTGATDRSSARQNLYMDGNVVSKSANYTARLTDRSKFFRTTATLTLSLKAAATVKDGWYIFVRVETGTTTINPNGSEKINGSATIDVAAGETVLVVCDGTAFYSTKLKGLLDISDDASPQLGGVLDTNGHAV
ncbi:MAG: hypothetical protein ACE5DK_11375, partial [Paracoccaceae bacterium]